MQHIQHTVLQREIPAQGRIILYFKDIFKMAKLNTQKYKGCLKALTWTHFLMHLHGVNVFNLHEVILYSHQDHGLTQYTQNGYSSLSEHLCNIYFTFRSIYQKQVLQQIYDMENFSLNV